MSPIDSQLSELGAHRKVVVSVPEYIGVPYVLAETNLLFTTGRPFAELLAEVVPLSIIETPPEFGTMTFYMLWHESKHRTQAHKWLREIMKDVAGVFGEESAVRGRSTLPRNTSARNTMAPTLPSVR